MSLSTPKVPKVKPPPTAPTRADARSFISRGFGGGAFAPESLISTGAAGLTTRASTQKKKLIGGN